MKEFTKPGWFTISLPDAWQVDEDESPMAMYDPEGVGPIQITTQAPPRALKPGERIDVFLLLRSFIAQTGGELLEENSKRYTKNAAEWAYTEFEGESGDGPAFWRLWFATNHEFFVFLTYACRLDDREQERAAVDGIVDSLKLLSARS